MIGQTPDKTGHVRRCPPAQMGGLTGQTRTNPFRDCPVVRPSHDPTQSGDEVNGTMPSTVRAKNGIALQFISLTKISDELLLHFYGLVERLGVSISDDKVEERQIRLVHLFRHCFSVESPNHYIGRLQSNNGARRSVASDGRDHDGITVSSLTLIFVFISHCRAGAHGQCDHQDFHNSAPRLIRPRSDHSRAVRLSHQRRGSVRHVCLILCGSFPGPWDAGDAEPRHLPRHRKNRNSRNWFSSGIPFTLPQDLTHDPRP